MLKLTASPCIPEQVPDRLLGIGPGARKAGDACVGPGETSVKFFEGFEIGNDQTAGRECPIWIDVAESYSGAATGKPAVPEILNHIFEIVF